MLTGIVSREMLYGNDVDIDITDRYDTRFSAQYRRVVDCVNIL